MSFAEWTDVEFVWKDEAEDEGVVGSSGDCGRDNDHNHRRDTTDVLTVKAERVPIKEVQVGDLILHWDKIVRVSKIQDEHLGRAIWAAHEEDGTGYQFLRYHHENAFRLTPMRVHSG